jgi:hypothetical protein
MKVLLRILLVLAVTYFSASLLTAAVTVTLTRPVYSGATDAAVAVAWATAETTLRAAAENSLAKYDDQEKLAKGFANANTYSVSAAPLDGYLDYNLFALMGGIMISAQMPAFTVNYDYLKNIRYKVEENGDIYFGTAIGTSIINAGVNAGFIYPGLYINLKYGYMGLNGKNINSDLEGFLYKTSIYGIGLNQIIVWPGTIVPGILKWRGVTIGSGFYYSKTETTITILKSLITESFGANSFILDPSFRVKIESETMTVPLYIMTSIKILQIINFNLGTGADFNYGSSEIKLKAEGDITTDLADPIVTPGSVLIEAGTKKKKPTMVNPKITTGLGFNFGPVKIDIPVAIYYLESGFSIGLSAGVIF